MVVVPKERAETKPVLETVANAGLLEVQGFAAAAVTVQVS
jgi:hypothetical protein